MTLTFPWGTVEDTQNGVSFTLTQGIQFDLPSHQIEPVAKFLTLPSSHGMVFGLGGVCPIDTAPTSDPKELLVVHLDPIEDDWNETLAKSSLKIGYGTPGIKLSSKFSSTPAILSRSDYMELAKAICDVANPVQATP